MPDHCCHCGESTMTVGVGKNADGSAFAYCRVCGHVVDGEEHEE